MGKALKILLGMGVVVLLLVMSLIGRYNKMVTYDEEVVTAWSQVENQYQRRFDLVPNLVSTVKGFASHEQETLTAVIEARSKATQTNVDIKDARAMASFQESQGALSSALSRLMVVVEKYPDLKANKNFLELQAQLEGTENRISVARKKFNEVVKIYNVYIRKFPNNMVAGMLGFEKGEQFEAVQEAQTAPAVDFE